MLYLFFADSFQLIFLFYFCTCFFLFFLPVYTVVILRHSQTIDGGCIVRTELHEVEGEDARAADQIKLKKEKNKRQIKEVTEKIEYKKHTGRKIIKGYKKVACEIAKSEQFASVETEIM